MILTITKKLIAGEIAEWVSLVRENIRRLEEDKKSNQDDSVHGFVTEIGGREDLLDGEVVAKHRFGFNI